MDVAWLVYLLECADGTLYCGITNDLAKRLAAHNAGRASRYSRARLPVRVVWSEPCADRSAALRREIAVKAMPRAAKLQMVAARARQLPRNVSPGPSP